MVKFGFFALIALLSVHLALSADPPKISPSPSPKLAADSTPTISPSKPMASPAPAPANAPHGSISSSPSLPPSDAALASSLSTSPSPPSQSPC
ncbi:pectinesterase inhibitor 10-like [Punica granatum]|uniref:Pectinesterase inhibitor 10-like n=1 Tax=Punica granatum TaxID=22663 RepID=A0A6P8BZF7_PUNGR|nr:pectinesterase inhibitor 10-like [Punica granatum]